jgi:hypothetical protein
MKRLTVVAAAAAISLSGLGLGTTGVADAAAAAKPSTQDVTWIKANAQTDLAEISLGTLVASKSTNASTRSLAKVTKSQHQTALAKLPPSPRALGSRCRRHRAGCS